MSHEQYVVVAMPVTMPVISIGTDLVIQPVNSGGMIMAVGSSVASLVSGVGTLVGKNDAGTQLFSIGMSAAGKSSGTINSAVVAPGDSIHLGFTGIGVGLTGVVVTIDLKLPSSA